MKLAVCIFGKFSGRLGAYQEGKILNPTFALKVYKDKIFKGHDVDIFIHSYEIERKEFILNLYRPKDYIIEPQINFDDINISDYKLKESKENETFYEGKSVKEAEYELTRCARATASRWLSTKKSINLMKNYSIQNKINYDFVLQMRFDLFFHDRIFLTKDQIGKFLCVPRSYDNYEAIDDLFFVSSFEQAIQFSTLYDSILNYSIRPPFAAKQHLDECKIQPTYYLKESNITLQREYEKSKWKLLIKSFISRIIKSKVFRYLNHVIIIRK